MSHPTIPLPYDYALISKASYYNDETALGAKHPELLQTLHDRGWRLAEPLQAGAYYGGIWVNDTQQQVVIAHRGSQNADSWVTDLESVVEGKPGAFVKAAINTLQHDRVRHYVALGYRLSTTGHSLGGFLAQVCAYWAKRPDFAASMPSTSTPLSAREGVGEHTVSSSSSSYGDVISSSSSSSSSSRTFPASLPVTRPAEVSAVVFDSPGVVEFLEQLQPRIRSHRDAIDLRALNIHNFCAMPTVVSTYGTQTGTVWHLGGVDTLRLAFVNAHKIEHLLVGFDPATGQPKRLRQMTDWPQADYSAYSSIGGLVETTTTNAIKLPFTILNALYKKIKRSSGPTWYDRVCQDKESEVSVALRSPAATDSAPSLESVTEQLNLAIEGHYSPMPAEDSEHRLGLYHFDQDVQNFLQDLVIARRWRLENIGWSDALTKHYGDFTALLQTLNMEVHGNRAELILPKDYPDTVFMFQQTLLAVIHEKGILRLSDFVVDKFVNLAQQLESDKQEFAGLSADSRAAKLLGQDIKILQVQLDEIQAVRKQLEDIAASPNSYEPPLMTLFGADSRLGPQAKFENNPLVFAELSPATPQAQLELIERQLDKQPNLRMVGVGPRAVIEGVACNNPMTIFKYVPASGSTTASPGLSPTSSSSDDGKPSVLPPGASS